MNEPTRYGPDIDGDMQPGAEYGREWVRYDDVAPYLPKTLTEDDETPPNHSVIADLLGQTFIVFGESMWSPVAYHANWRDAFAVRGPLTLIHRGGTE